MVMRPSDVLAKAALLLLMPWTLLAAPSPGQPDADARLRWWEQARFGMFVHWGPVSLRGTEIGWSRGEQVPVAEYDALYQRFNPTNFDANAWAKLARDTGMKYLVLTSKHHDGFCLWDSKLTDFTIAHTPFKRDVTRELADACRKQGLVFSLYHSICDWRHPDYPLGSPGGRSTKPNPNMDRYFDYLKGQLGELIKGYGPLGILWFDGEWETPWTSARARELDAYLRALQPSLIINNRIDKGRQDMEGSTAEGDFLGDYDTPEQRVGRFQDSRPWESCITLCQQWAWKPDDKMKSLQECVRTLVLCVGGDGNLLLNIGPMPDGRIEPRQAERLRELGAWLKRYGATIYGTRGGPFKPGAWGASTRKGKEIYLHVFAWPEDGLRLPPIPAHVRAATTFAGKPLSWQQSDKELVINAPPPSGRDTMDTVLKLTLDTDAASLAPRNVNPSARTTLAKTILKDERMDKVLAKARQVLSSGLNAGSGYGEVWIRDLNTFIELALDVQDHAALREALLTFFHFQGADGNIIDGYIPVSKANVGYKYIHATTKPGLLGHKNTVETDQESSLVQAVHKYVTKTGDGSLLDEVVNGRTVRARLADAMGYVLRDRFEPARGLVWGATTVDWGDVQPEHPWGVEFDASSHKAIDIYDNAMLVIAMRDYAALPGVSTREASAWTHRADKLRVAVRKHLWDSKHQKFIPHLYLAGSPFPAGFDENKIHYHGGTASAIEAGILTDAEIAHTLAAMRANVRAAGAASIGLTVYPVYPKGTFQNQGMGPYSYQNGGDWTWFGGRMIQQLAVRGFPEEALKEVSPMLDRVLANDGFFEWYTVDNKPRGSGTFRGEAGVLAKAISLLRDWAGRN